MRTISEPARASAAVWATVASMSAVSVLVIDCTTMGAPPPTTTPPTFTGTVRRRDWGPAGCSAGKGTMAVMNLPIGKDAH
jgi:hypothetical protein